MLRFRVLFSYTFFLTCAGLCLAQVIQPGSKRNFEKYSLSGVVVNAVTGAPLKRALVELYAQQPRAMLTDTDGQFQFDGLPLGMYSLQTRKPGFFSERDIYRGMRGIGQILVGPNSPSVTLKLLPEAIISGSVTDADGLPVPHIQIRTLRRQIENGRARWEPAQQKATDENGAYRIAGLMPGTYALSVGPNVAFAASSARGRQQGFRETYFPSATDLTSAAKIALNPGQRMEANFSLTVEPFYTVRGTFSGDVGSVNLMLVPSSSEASPNMVGLSTIEGTNRFEAKSVPPGMYRLEATGTGSAGHSVIGSVPLNVRADVFNAHVSLQPMVSIPIEVDTRHVSTRQNDQSVVVSGRGRNQVGYLTLLGKSSWRGSAASPIAPNISIPNVSPGIYSLQFNVNAPWYVESVTHDNSDLLTDGLVVTPSGEQTPIRFVLRDDGALLRPQLQLQSDTGEQAATLLVIPDGGEGSQIREFPMPGRGELYLPPMKPGGYTLLAIDDATDLEYTNPELLAPYLSRGTHVTLSPDQETSVKLELIHRRSE